jgi:putative FmdB family regulatory protein
MIYEYICKNDHPFEIVKRMSESERQEFCPHCGEQGRRIYCTNFFIKDFHGEMNLFRKSGNYAKDPDTGRVVSKRTLKEQGKEGVRITF